MTFLHRAKWTLIALAYLAFPIDLCPDFFLGLGWLDDVAFFAYAMRQASQPPKAPSFSAITKYLSHH